MTAAPDGTGPTTRERLVSVEVDGRAYAVALNVTEPPWAGLARHRRERAAARDAGGTGAVRSPMQGTVLKVAVDAGDGVAAGQVLFVVEAMKMENEIVAPRAGVVRDIGVSPARPWPTASSSASITEPE